MNVIVKHLNDSAYFKNESHKSTICLHHTAGGPNPFNAMAGWNQKNDKVATSYLIAGKSDASNSYKDGDIVEAFDPKYWGWHLGISTPNNTQLNSQAIAIEVANWGQLTKRADGAFINYVGGVIPPQEVFTFQTPFKGYSYFHKYTDAQVQALKELIQKLIVDFKISDKFNPDMFDLSQNALKGDGGVWAHVSYRPSGKWDICPQTNIVTMLTSILKK